MNAEKTTIVVLHHSGADGATSGAARQALDVAQALGERGREATCVPVDRETLFAVFSGLAGRGDTVVFNLVGSLGGDARHGPLAAGLLALHGLRFTGNSASTLSSCLDKRLTKALLFAGGIPTPGARVFRTTPKVDAVRDMVFPLVVKPLREAAQPCLTPPIFVSTPEELCARVHEALCADGRPVLGEVYLPGREFLVAVTGEGKAAQALPVSERVFEGYAEGEPLLPPPPSSGTGDSRQTRFQCPADVGEHGKVSLTTTALAAYRALECRDYARIGLRLDARGTPNVLRVDPSPDVARDAGFSRSVEASGDQYSDFLERLVEWASARS